MGEDNNSLEEWNMGASYLENLHRTLIRCELFQRQDMIQEWYMELKILYKILHAKLKDKEKALELKNALMEAYNKSKLQNKPIKIRIFEDFELYLRECIESMGLLTPKSEDPLGNWRGQ